MHKSKNQATLRTMALVLGWLFVLSLLFLPLSLHSQDRLKTYPNYDRYERLSKEIREAVKSGALRVTWKDNGEALEFARDGKQWRFDLRTKKLTEIGKAADQPPMPFGRRAGFPERGRQFTQAESPDKKFKAVYRDRNLYLEDQATKAEIAITADGSDKTRVKYGTASWVYGEELDQITAMWWSPDSRKLAFYRFDEKNVPDYFLQAGPDQALQQGGYRTLSQGRRAQSRGRPAGLRPGHQENNHRGCPQRTALLQRGGRTLCLRG